MDSPDFTELLVVEMTIFSFEPNREELIPEKAEPKEVIAFGTIFERPMKAKITTINIPANRAPFNIELNLSVFFILAILPLLNILSISSID